MNPLRPRTIFSTVAAVCLLLMALLPRLTAAPRALAAAPVAVRNQADTPNQSHQTVTPEPTANPIDVQAATSLAKVAQSDIPHTSGDADLDHFASHLFNGQADILVGAYAAGLFALPVIEQPVEDENYVADADQVLTHYRSPSAYHVTGLLAHNTLSGSAFSQLDVGQTITLIYGDGSRKTYQITILERYQALQPDSTLSDFINLADPDAHIISHTSLFEHIYTNPGQLVLQTCIAHNGNLSWGRLFVIADPQS